jgi:hypothetical protein
MFYSSFVVKYPLKYGLCRFLLWIWQNRKCGGSIDFGADFEAISSAPIY